MWRSGMSTPLSVQVQKIWSDFALCHLCSITAVGSGYHPWHTGVISLLPHQVGGAKHQEFCCQFLPKWQLWPFLFFNCFLWSQAKIIAFIWCWVTDLIRKSWLKRLADFFFFVPFGSFIINNVEREMFFAIVLLWIDWQVIICAQNYTCMWGNQEIT